MARCIVWPDRFYACCNARFFAKMLHACVWLLQVRCNAFLQAFWLLQAFLKRVATSFPAPFSAALCNRCNPSQQLAACLRKDIANHCSPDIRTRCNTLERLAAHFFGDQMCWENALQQLQGSDAARVKTRSNPNCSAATGSSPVAAHHFILYGSQNDTHNHQIGNCFFA